MGRSNLRVSLPCLLCAFAFLAAPVHAMTIGGGGDGPAGEQLFDPESRAALGKAPGGLASRPGGGFAVTLPSEGEVRFYDAQGLPAGLIFVPGRPVSVAFLPDGQILVGLASSGQVVRYTPQGVKAGFLGRGAGEFGCPADIAVDASLLRVWVADSLRSRLRVFRWDGLPLFDAGAPGQAAGELDGPNSLAFHAGAGRVVVSDFGNKRIQIFGREGSFLGVLPVTPGPDEGSIFRPAGVAVDALGRILVSGAYQGWVQAFDAAGTYLGWCAQYGTDTGRVMNPADLAVDADNRLYVVSFGSEGIEILRSRAAATLDETGDSVPVERSALVTFPAGVLDRASAGPAVFRIECWGLATALVRDGTVRLNDALDSLALRDAPGETAGILEADFAPSALAALAGEAASLQVEIRGTTWAGESFAGATTVALASTPADDPGVDVPGEGSSSRCAGAPGGEGAPLAPLLILFLAMFALRASAPPSAKGSKR